MSYIPSGTGTPIFEQLCREHAALGMAHPVYAQATAAEAATERIPARTGGSASVANGRLPQSPSQVEVQTEPTVPARAKAQGRTTADAQPTAPATTVSAPVQPTTPAQPTASEVADATQSPAQPQRRVQSPVNAPAQRGSHAALARRAPRERVA